MKELILNAPGKNALSTDLMRSVLDDLKRAGGAPLLVTGAGDAFSAGLNLKEVLSLTASTAPTFLALLEDMVEALYCYEGPMVALVNGHAIAGGCVVALCADHRVMKSGTRARIGLNETAIGLPFPPRVLALAEARLPRQQRERILLGGELYDAESALTLGLVDEVAEDASSVAGERLAALATRPPQAYAVNKLALRKGRLAANGGAKALFDRVGLPLWYSDSVKDIIRGLLS
ncbi:MAG: enoyl-CoA hydratase/isomerase family protein [Myxococcales bacterium]|nr:enoyl-CoA hydratase/isomerase family protein [Myxococcales bacterium]MCB9575755.1 enoyl-CoA hydratase/isomerase family protein [Polyangiaceae bacterium]